ncbi:uncharacterized protein LOC132048856 [Lycium ferocissimum]|uniref:uncharacterized protein LOC132048856 n=1 Tax=Lycium ferocissimum TaxID=112874 RepID=UPI002814A1FC|nr:uncharacterized protein LOC132048856 [Lycium ferocissimum]
MTKGLNATVITLIPKGTHAATVGDYRPISCCNTLYKVTSKMLCSRMKSVLPTIISENQSAFVKERSIVQNILICQDLVRLYNRKAAIKSCLIKIDLRKAYDTVEWDFVKEILYGLNGGLYGIMECLTTTRFSIAINGGLCGDIEGKRGLRQGDPVSPFFVCSLHGVLYKNHEMICLSFSKGEFSSILLMLRGLKSFSISSGLTTNASKSNIFHANMDSRSLDEISEITRYERGRIPFRVQLVNSVLMHIHSYWSSIFILPKSVLKQMTTLCRNFLWAGQENTNKTPLIAWDLVCRSKKEGGLGVIDCITWNEATVAKSIGNIADKADTLWGERSQNFIYGLKNVFRVMHATEIEMAKLATYQLQDVAHI